MCAFILKNMNSLTLLWSTVLPCPHPCLLTPRCDLFSTAFSKRCFLVAGALWSYQKYNFRVLFGDGMARRGSWLLEADLTSLIGLVFFCFFFNDWVTGSVQFDLTMSHTRRTYISFSYNVPCSVRRYRFHRNAKGSGRRVMLFPNVRRTQDTIYHYFYILVTSVIFKNFQKTEWKNETF